MLREVLLVRHCDVGLVQCLLNLSKLRINSRSSFNVIIVISRLHVQISIFVSLIVI